MPELLRREGVGGGVVVQLGCRDVREIAAMGGPGGFVIQAVDRSAERVAQARARIQALGCYGPVSVQVLTSGKLPYADNLVNAVVVEDARGVPPSEIQRVLRPLGTVWTRDGSAWRKTVKPWPAEFDDWTHFLHDATGNAVSADTAAGPPRRMQWTAGPLWSRHHNTVPSVSAMVSAKGRVFAIVDEAPPAMAGTAPDKWLLVARDAFNGVELWRRPMADWGWREWSTISSERFNQPNNIPKRLVAVGDRVYVTLGYNAELTALDAATGKVIRHYKGTDLTDEILYQDGLLILSINKQPQAPGEIKDKPPVHKRLAVLEAETGKMLWTTGDFVGNSTKTGPLERVTHLLLAARGKQVFGLDGEAVVSLDLATGRPLWRSPRPKSPDYTSRYHHRMSEMCTLVAAKGVVLLCQLEPIQKRIGWRVIKARLQAYDAKSGKPLWQYRCGNWGHFCSPDLFVTGGLVWVHDQTEMSMVGLDPRSGVEKRRLSSEKALDNGHHHRCYRNKATERYMLFGYRGMEFLDWASGTVDRNHWARGTCRYGVMPANGMVYATPHPCDCYITSKLNGFWALSPAGAAGQAKATGDGDRLQPGPAYGKADVPPAGPGKGQPSPPADWPTYRHDDARTGGAPGGAPAALTIAWKASPAGGRITAPVVAEGKVLVASVDAHTVRALDAETGAPRWSFVADGPVDTPPTVWKGRALFGDGGGWVYCLRMSDGATVWRFLAAPARRQVVARGQLESAWPVHGSVLVREGKVYATAGRSSFLDGGIMAWCLDAATGKVLSERRIAHPQDMDVDAGRNQSGDTGVLSDLLVAEGEGVYMRHIRVFGPGQADPGWGRRVGATGGMLDDSWFNRTLWLVDGQDQGELLVHDDAGVYAVRVHASRGHGQYIVPGTGAYHVVATDRARGPVARPDRKGKLNTTKWPRAKKTRWSLSMPVRVTAMAVAGKTLLCAGTPDALDPKEPWATYEGRRGGLLMALATADGTQKARVKLDAAPVYDGMAVADGKLFLSCVDGTLLCFGRR